MTEARSIVGDCDMTLYQIVELLIRQREAMLLQSQPGSNGTTSTKLGPSQSGAAGLTQACRLLLLKQDSKEGRTPLHHAFKNGNVELVLCIFGFIKQNLGGSHKENENQNGIGPASELTNELLNAVDDVSITSRFYEICLSRVFYLLYLCFRMACDPSTYWLSASTMTTKTLSKSSTESRKTSKSRNSTRCTPGAALKISIWAILSLTKRKGGPKRCYSRN